MRNQFNQLDAQSGVSRLAVVACNEVEFYVPLRNTGQSLAREHVAQDMADELIERDMSGDIETEAVERVASVRLVNDGTRHSPFYVFNVHINSVHEATFPAFGATIGNRRTLHVNDTREAIKQHYQSKGYKVEYIY